MNFKQWKWSCKNCKSKELRIIGRYDLSIRKYFQLLSEKQIAPISRVKEPSFFWPNLSTIGNVTPFRNFAKNSPNFA
jgi:hypothetical protein